MIYQMIILHLLFLRCQLNAELLSDCVELGASVRSVNADGLSDDEDCDAKIYTTQRANIISLLGRSNGTMKWTGTMKWLGCSYCFPITPANNVRGCEEVAITLLKSHETALNVFQLMLISS